MKDLGAFAPKMNFLLNYAGFCLNVSFSHAAPTATTPLILTLIPVSLSPLCLHSDGAGGGGGELGLTAFEELF